MCIFSSVSKLVVQPDDDDVQRNLGPTGIRGEDAKRRPSVHAWIWIKDMMHWVLFRFSFHYWTHLLHWSWW